MMRKNNWSRQESQKTRLEWKSSISFVKWAILLLYFFLSAGCSNHHSKTPAEKIKFYESRARHYQTLSDLQRLSPPFSSPNHKQFKIRFDHDHLRMAYLNESRRYRKLADKIRANTVSDSNETGE